MWPQIRAALIALHVIAITLLALPAPDGGMDRETWKNPTVQEEFKNWTQTLNACGLDITQQELEDRLWAASQTYMDARSDVLQPFLPYYNYCGTFQAWRMFVGPHRYPAVLHIDVSEGGVWRPVYIERDAHHRWLGRQLDSYRFRATLFRLGWPAYEGEFDHFARWVGRQAARDFPDADRVRVRLYRSRTRSPQEVRAGAPTEGEFGHTVELPLRAQP